MGKNRKNGEASYPPPLGPRRIKAWPEVVGCFSANAKKPFDVTVYVGNGFDIIVVPSCQANI
jgi:hypothetical protein